MKKKLSIFQSQYKDKKFKNEELFNKWLKRTATKKIIFEDDGQDFLEWYIDDRGEVLHSAPFQAWIWNGKIVDIDNIRVRSNLQLLNGDIMKHRVKSIINL